jgi:hypothetical protein
MSTGEEPADRDQAKPERRRPASRERACPPHRWWISTVEIAGERRYRHACARCGAMRDVPVGESPSMFPDQPEATDAPDGSAGPAVPAERVDGTDRTAEMQASRAIADALRAARDRT